MKEIFNKHVDFFEGKSLKELKEYFPLTYAKFKRYKKTKLYVKRSSFYENYAPKTKYNNYDDYILHFRNKKVAPFINHNFYIKNTFEEELNFFDKHHAKRIKHV